MNQHGLVLTFCPLPYFVIERCLKVLPFGALWSVKGSTFVHLEVALQSRPKHILM